MIKERLEKFKKNYLLKLEEKLEGKITSIEDLTAGEDPTLLFYLLINSLDYLLDADPEKTISKEGIAARKRIHFIIDKLGPLFLGNPQVIEDRMFLADQSDDLILDAKNAVVLPDEPVIWVANHGFKDDILASVLAAKRHAYVLLASLPHAYNSFDGVTAWLNGTIITNRKVQTSRKAVIDKCKKVLENGSDVLIFMEGVWNKTPEKLVLDLYPGAYKLAKETGYKIVPITHYIKDPAGIKDKSNIIHTVIDHPIDVSDMSQEEALSLIRDNHATWTYLMMDKYGRSTRDEILNGFANADEAWEYELARRRQTVGKYDETIEMSADFRNKKIARPEEVWEVIANIDNVTSANAADFAFAKQLVKREKRRDFQRRF